MSNANTIKSYLNTLNVFKEYGSIELVPHTDNPGFEQLLPDDVVIYADFMSDDCPDNATVDRLSHWYNDLLFARIDHFMNKLGYKIVEDIDGSGGGLYYGAVQYRPAQHVAD
jgi:hypothetical protein